MGCERTGTALPTLNQGTDGEIGPGKEKTREEFNNVFHSLKHHDMVPSQKRLIRETDISVIKGRSLIIIIIAQAIEDRKSYFKG